MEVSLKLRHPPGCILFLVDDESDDDAGCTASGQQLLSSLPPLLILNQVTEKLLEVENENMMKVADLEKLLLQKDKDLQLIRVSVENGPLLQMRSSGSRKPVIVLLSVSPW